MILKKNENYFLTHSMRRENESSFPLLSSMDFQLFLHVKDILLLCKYLKTFWNFLISFSLLFLWCYKAF